MFYYLYSFANEFSFLNIFKYISFRSFGALLTSSILFFVFGKSFIRLLHEHQIGQQIREEGPSSHQSKKGTPTMGGLLILGSSLISALLWGNFSNLYFVLCLLMMVGYGALGFYDDYKKVTKRHNEGLKGRYKLLFQFSFAFLFGFVLIHFLGFDTQLNIPIFKKFHPDLGYAYLFFIALVIVGSSNAVNLTDGLDGLVSVPSIVSLLTYAIFSYVAGHAIYSSYLQLPYVHGAGELTVFCAALVGALFGFLWYNTYPAEIFMGDTGSLSLGACLGTVAVISKNEILLMIIGGIFVMEAMSVIAQVASYKIRKKRIFKMAPIHHHFELKGWAEPKVIVRFWIISFILSIIALSTLKIR